MKKILLAILVLFTFMACGSNVEQDEETEAKAREVGGIKSEVGGKAWDFKMAKIILVFNQDGTFVGNIKGSKGNDRFFGRYTDDGKVITLDGGTMQIPLPYKVKGDELVSSTWGSAQRVEMPVIPPLKGYEYREMKVEEGIFVKRDASDEEIKGFIDGLTLEEKVGQMFTIGVWGQQELDERYREFIKKAHIGGVLIYSRNVLSHNHLIDFINELKEVNHEGSNIPLMTAIDNEGGYKVQLPRNLPNSFPNSMIPAKISPEENYMLGEEMGEFLNSMGINMNYGTMADIDFTEKEDGMMAMRAYGSDPQVVSDYAIAYSKGNSKAHVTPVYKHFPGHGKTSTDSHTSLPVLNLSRDELERELLPYKNAIADNSIDALMTAHIVLDGIDEYPATLSKKILTGILRDELGYEGVVITDDIEMGAISNYYDFGEAVVKTVEAGTDIVLVCHTYERQEEAYDALVEAVRKGKISEERIDESVFRILKLKKKYDYTDNLKGYLDIEEEKQELDEFLKKLDIEV